MKKVVVTGAFDDLGWKHVRFLEEASKLGDLYVFLWPDSAVARLEGRLPKYTEQEQLYLLQSLRYVREVRLAGDPFIRDELFHLDGLQPDIWAVDETGDTPERRSHAVASGIEYRVFRHDELRGFPVPPFRPPRSDSGCKRVIVTGCFDWFHSGHVRFFEEASALGDLYAVVGHDANIMLLKGEGHPLFPQEQRRYMVYAVRYVQQALISTGQGWMDAAPEIAAIRPDIYFVNEDGDRPEKRAFCRAQRIELVVSRRVPKEGLPSRRSTDLRGF